MIICSFLFFFLYISNVNFIQIIKRVTQVYEKYIFGTKQSSIQITGIHQIENRRNRITSYNLINIQSDSVLKRRNFGLAIVLSKSLKFYLFLSCEMHHIKQ